MNAILTCSFALALTASASFASAQEHVHAGHGAPDDGATLQASVQQASPQLELADGEVKKVDKDAGKLTLRHGELKNLNMAPMTMVFRVKDAAMLDQVKVGDKVRFNADRVNGAVTILELQAAN